jgi:hypothetical protein
MYEPGDADDFWAYDVSPNRYLVRLSDSDYGRLDLGPGEQIFYGEFDGRRRKRVLVKVIGE